MFFCAFGPTRLRLNSSIGSPNPAADCFDVEPEAVTSPERCPIGQRGRATIAERSNSVKVRA